MLEPFHVFLYATDQPNDGGPWWGVGIDISKCIGCGLCARACKLENQVPQEPFYFRTWVEQYTILNDGTTKVESPNGGMDGFDQSVDEKDIFKAGEAGLPVFDFHVLHHPAVINLLKTLYPLRHTHAHNPLQSNRAVWPS